MRRVSVYAVPASGEVQDFYCENDLTELKCLVASRQLDSSVSADRQQTSIAPLGVFRCGTADDERLAFCLRDV